MRETPLHVQIRPLAATEIRLLEWHLAFDWAASGKHRQRFERQEVGEVVYLVAWYDDAPVGHVLLKWQGPTNPELATPRDCPDLEDLFVSPVLRSRGIGSQLLAAAESLAVQRGCSRIGLAVDVANSRARALYRRRGYRKVGRGTFVNRWSWLGRDGQKAWSEETCIYLVKDWGAGEGSAARKNLAAAHASDFLPNIPEPKLVLARCKKCFLHSPSLLGWGALGKAVDQTSAPISQRGELGIGISLDPRHATRLVG
jgi:GNAT superfamily N-acetyltransferase